MNYLYPYSNLPGSQCSPRPTIEMKYKSVDPDVSTTVPTSLWDPIRVQYVLKRHVHTCSINLHRYTTQYTGNYIIILYTTQVIISLSDIQ